MGLLLFLFASSVVFQGFNLETQFNYVMNTFPTGISMIIFAGLAGFCMAFFTISAYFTEYSIYIVALQAMVVSSLIFSMKMQHFPLFVPHDSQIIPCYGMFLGLLASFYAYEKIVDIMGLRYIEEENPYGFDFQDE